MQSFYPISCIQRPETGRELDFVGDKVATPRRILVAGGGPAGL
jgi:NADPH-dependent 2,4-dienoyl-CoA reductase/sulfur reductase-like enzyme